MVKSFGSRDVSADEYCCACFRSNVFRFHTAVIAQILCLYYFSGSLFDWQLSIKKNKTNKLQFQDKLNRRTCSTWVFSPNSLSLFHWICSTWLFSADTLSGDVYPLDYFTQTFCNHETGTSSTWSVYRDKQSHSLNQTLNYFHSVFKMKKNWLRARAVFFFMLSNSFYRVSICGNKVLINTGYIFLVIDTLLLLQSSCYNFTFISDHSVKLLLMTWNPPSVPRKVLLKIEEPKLQS